MGKNLLRNLCPKLAEALRMPRVVNRDMRATAIQALRMAKFSTEEVCKISRHKQASTVERNYNIGLHSDQRADMAVAIAQAPLLKRGHEFQSVSEHLPRKTSLGQVQLANPSEMVPTRADKAQMVGKEVTVEERLQFKYGCVVQIDRSQCHMKRAEDCNNTSTGKGMNQKPGGQQPLRCWGPAPPLCSAAPPAGAPGCAGCMLSPGAWGQGSYAPCG